MIPPLASVRPRSSQMPLSPAELSRAECPAGLHETMVAPTVIAVPDGDASSTVLLTDCGD